MKIISISSLKSLEFIKLINICCKLSLNFDFCLKLLDYLHKNITKF